MNRRILVSGLKPALYVAVFFAVCALHARSMEAGPGPKLPTSPSMKTPSTSPLQITSQTEGENSVKIQIKIASSVQSPSLNVHLNGTEISSLFSRTGCGNAVCETATVKTSDGLRQEKNVLAVIAAPGISSRYRFDAVEAPTASSLQKVSDAARASHNSTKMGLSAQAAGPGVLNPFLPPTISFKTNNPGGWSAGNPWFTIGTQSFPSDTNPSNCSGTVYMAVIVDRQTLTEKTSAPESSPQCFANEASLTSYLTGLNSDDLAVVGSNFGHSPGGSLDLRPIGGSLWGAQSAAGIMDIGVGGAAEGSAYESFYEQKTGYEAINAFATGTVQEDAYGNYNFQSSDVVEFTVSPNADPSGLTGTSSSTIVVQLPKSAESASDGGAINAIYTPPAGMNGYWLLILSRNSLFTPVACPSKAPDIHDLLVSNCGTFYATGSSDAATSTAAYKQLATDLSNVNSFQLAILTTVGQAAYGGSANSIWDVGGFNQTYGGPSNGVLEFSEAISALGGQPGLTQSVLTPTSAYTFITSPGIQGPLNGNSIESSSSLPAQGQSGLVHGILQRNLNGLFMPQQTNQESFVDFQNKNGLNSTEFKLTEAALQQPVDWPSSSSTTLLPGAATLGGQVDAYRYLSYVLLVNVYMPGITGAHLDDLHYFFTGSLNTSINYHYYEPYNIVWPGANTTGPYVLPCNSIDNTNPENPVCTVAIVTGGQQVNVVFSEDDFYAVLPQMGSEIHYLTDTLQYLVTGSTNMKDVIAGGSSNAGLALTGAAATVLGSKLVPAPPTTTVTISWQNIVSMLGGVSSLVSGLPGIGTVGGLIAEGSKVAAAVGAGASSIGGAADLAAGAGGIVSSSQSQTLPSAFAKFSTTIGDLANGSMQDQLSLGFDSMADSITSDWGRLSTIGPLTLNTNDLTFFSPNQVTQTIAVASLTQAASRNFYIALLPTFYQVDFWQGVSGDATNPANNQLDMGYGYGGGGISGNDPYKCNAYYLNPSHNNSNPGDNLGPTPPNVSVYYPSPGGTPQYFNNDYSSWGIDYYVIEGAVTGAGTQSPTIQLIDPTLASELFTNAGLNLPIDEFVAQAGPMSSVWFQASAKNPASHQNPTVCNARIFPSTNPTEPGGGGSSPVAGNPLVVTTTALSVPLTSVLGYPVPMQATVTTASGPVTSGQVLFLDNGSLVNTVPVDSTGTASASLSAPVLGTHSIVAQYSVAGANPIYRPSTSNASTLTVYSSQPDLSLMLSQASVQIGTGTASAPISITATSLAGAAGTINFTCSGLPAGTSCTFTPKQTTITDGGTATTSVVVNVSSGTAAAGVGSGRGLLGLLLIPASVWMLWLVRRGGKGLRAAVMAVLLLLSAGALGGLMGCGGSGKPPATGPTGTQTILINASMGSMTKTVSLDVTF